MPKQIKISDELYERLRDIGDGKSMTQTISDLLEENPARGDDTADLYQFLVDNFTRLEEKIDRLGSIPEKKMSDFASREQSSQVEKNIKDGNPAGEDKSGEVHTLISQKNRLAEPKKEVEPSQKDISGKVEVKSYSQLKAEKARIEMEYSERMGYCQDTDSVRELYAEMNKKIEPIQAKIDAFFNK